MGPSAFYVVFSILMKLVKSWVGRCWICGWWMVLTLLFIARQISQSSIHPIHPSSRQCIIINDTFWQVATCPSWGGALHYSCDLTMVEEHRDRYVSVKQPTTQSMLDRPECVTKTYRDRTLWSWPSTYEGTPGRWKWPSIRATDIGTGGRWVQAPAPSSWLGHLAAPLPIM